MKWYWVTDTWQNKSSWKSHMIPETLKEPVMEALHERGFHHYKMDSSEGKLSIDNPGMIMTTREYRHVEVDGLTVEIPCTDFQDFYDRLSNLKVRDDANELYYKLHGWRKCLCLTPTQRDDMLKQMVKLLPEANAQAEIENRRFNEAFSKGPAVLADDAEEAGQELKKAKNEGRDIHIVAKRRPTNKDIGSA